MKTFLVFCLIFLLLLSPARLLAGEGTIPEPVYVPPLTFHDIAFTPDTVQLGLNDYGRGIVTATVTLTGGSVQESITLTQTIYSTANTSWLVAPLPPGEWTLRQLYAQDTSGQELNIFFIPRQYFLYFPQVSN